MKLTYSEKFEERRNKINELLEEIHKKDSNFLVQAIYEVANLEDFYNNRGYSKRLNGTSFSSLDAGEIYESFTSKVFNKLDNKKMEELLQEVYNRQAKSLDCEPRYIVNLGPSTMNVYGYMQTDKNELFINSDAIDRYLNEKTPDSLYGRNSENVGPYTLMTLLHETQHTCQYEGIMKFILNEETSEKERIRDCICLLKSAMTKMVEYHYEDGFEPDDYYSILGLMNNSYWYDYMEHDANMAPIRNINQAIKKGLIKDDNYITCAVERILRDIHIADSTEDEYAKDLNERKLRMETVLTRILDSFEENFENGPLKKQMLEILRPYFKVENNTSPFRKDIENDFNMCLDFLEFAKRRNLDCKNEEMMICK